MPKEINKLPQLEQQHFYGTSNAREWQLLEYINNILERLELIENQINKE